MDNLDATRWQAVENRDEQSTGLFIYAVTTTGIYCRPGCGSRRPLRKNVEFYFTPLEAARAGYRSCKRCTPDQTSIVDPATQAVVSVCRALESDQTDHDVAALAAQVGYSERHLRRLFLERVGVSIGTYQRALLAERARVALKSGVPVTQAVIDAGYGSSRAFYEHGATRLGMSPGRYRDGGRGERISFTSLLTPIGVVIAARTTQGVCAVMVGPDEVALTKELANEFPNALIERDDDGLADVALVLGGAVRGEIDPTKLPLDLEGTAFQIRVWEALRTIPTGQTRTYSQVATLIGEPNAVRAVGTACGKNPVAITVPCHRVVRTDGTLGGYRWGIDVKETLLKAEGTHAGS
jgi:AraC family transcriptional regulator, regulatory protein of adaptative response / methylated-DNA-[protein]-cysteine methyltransferase